MKKIKIFVLLLAAVILVLLLGSCHQAVYNLEFMVGTWEGDGKLELLTMEMELGEIELDEETSFDTVEILHFAADGTGYMMCGGEKMEFTFVMTDDTLTIRFPEISVGWRYEIKNDTLIVRDSEFRRIA